MKNFRSLAGMVPILFIMGTSCSKVQAEQPESLGDGNATATLHQVAKMLSALPIGGEQLGEVHDAVSSSSGNGFDEEYTMKNLFESPGSGVGGATKAGSYKTTMRDLISEYLQSQASTKASGGVSPEEYIRTLTESDVQIYWPYSDDWDGESYPIVTFDPGGGAESNYGYEIRYGEDGSRMVDSVFVDESVAAKRPVWVINTNEDSAFTPLDMFIKGKSLDSAPSSSSVRRKLLIKRMTVLRNYDSWFGGASEFFIKCGAVDGFKATTEAELKNYQPSVTDFMVSVKRKQIGKEIPVEALLLTDYTSQMDKIAFLVIEDDGGTVTSWQCKAEVKIKSKSFGFDIEIPYREKDDIVWRGQLSTSFFEEEDEVQGRFGDVRLVFALE